MKFQVPQFIEVEDKIFGPFTFKQFLYLVGGAGMIAIVFSIFPKIIAFFISVPIAALSIALTFYKINNRPFIYVLEAFFKYIVTNKLFIWKMSARGSKKAENTETQPREVSIPKVSQNKLKDITWDLSVKGSNPQESNKEEGV